MREPLKKTRSFWAGVLCFSAVMVFPSLLDASVFSLWPFSKGGGNVSKDSHESALWTEPVVVNGVRAQLSISMYDSGLADCLASLKGLYPGAQILEGGNSAVAFVDLKNGMVRRIYLVELGGLFPVLRFELETPLRIPKKFDWPARLPMTSDARPLEHVSYSSRNTDYGSFQTSLPPGQAFSEINSGLLASGWKSAAGKSAQSGKSECGGFFISPDSGSVMLVSVAPDGKGSSMGVVYRKPLK